MTLAMFFASHEPVYGYSRPLLCMGLFSIFLIAEGRWPKSLDELNEWLATDEGKEATIFESTSASRWGEVGPS
jgi:hypothetical protein